MSDEDILHSANQIRVLGEREWRDGPWRFVSQGAIGAYPRWVHRDTGTMVFHDFVMEAR